MTMVNVRQRMLLVAIVFLLSVWAVSYWLWPRISFDDGPFFAWSFTGELIDLSIVSSVDLRMFGVTVFVLETRAMPDPDTRTVFVLKNRRGTVRWAKQTAAEFGRIRILGGSARWFVPGGWVVTIKPEREESGDLYLSPLGDFRFFYHSW
jgi:hypothetical protein